MHITYQAFRLQKAGNPPDEYEDAFAPAAHTAVPTADGRVPTDFYCAVADGATETSFSGLWAQRLVDAFVGQRLERIMPNTICDLAGEWDAAIAERTRAKPLPWYAEEKLKKGAFATLAGLHVRADGWWMALCVGDSCVFQLRPGAWIKSFPYSQPSHFNNSPLLWSTNTAQNTCVEPKRTHGKWKSGDYFLLMTDALAHYFLSDETVRAQIHHGLDQESFEALIQAARHDKLCKNDDVTLLTVYPGVRAESGGVA
ncbi:MAG: protein phosphatase 2C domain-containing protein [Aggregatilineales bacterium]